MMHKTLVSFAHEMIQNFLSYRGMKDQTIDPILAMYTVPIWVCIQIELPFLHQTLKLRMFDQAYAPDKFPLFMKILPKLRSISA